MKNHEDYAIGALFIVAALLALAAIVSLIAGLIWIF